MDLARAAVSGSDIPPRIRVVHDRAGHASPEFRTLAVPLPPGGSGASPTILSGSIAAYARRNPPSCLILVLDVVSAGENGDGQSLLIGEARDRSGTRLFLVQPFGVVGGRVIWREALQGGWRDPGDEEMIIDAAFR